MMRSAALPKLRLFLTRMGVSAAMVAASSVASAGPSLTEDERVLLHVGGSAATAFVAETVAAEWLADTPAFWTGVAVGMVPGVIKEVHDAKRGQGVAARRYDLQVDLVGAVAGAFASQLLREKTGWTLGLSSRRVTVAYATSF